MLPIVPWSSFRATESMRSKARDYARRLLREPKFRKDQEYSNQVVSGLCDARALVVDDFTDISQFPSSSLYLQQRARLRAEKGDMVVTTSPVDRAFDDYMSLDLQLGKVNWMQVQTDPGSIATAHSCWRDRETRRAIVHAVRREDLLYIHPFMGNVDVWRLAQLISNTAHRPVQVIAPTPAVSRWANNKVAFATVVTDLLGSQYIPETKSAYNFALLCQRVHELAQSNRYIGIKVPNAAGGRGNVFLDARHLRELSLFELNDQLHALIDANTWPADAPLLVDVWETNVIESASIQTWIPPVADGDPVLEGVFSQIIEGVSGHFVGCIPLELPDVLERTVVEATTLLALLFQQMGYVGRCSFDFLLVGENLDDCDIEFIECNARWGGTSVPMTLVNRLFGDWTAKPFAAVTYDGMSMRGADIAGVIEALRGEELYCAGAEGSQGWLIPFNPGRLASHSGLDWIVLGSNLVQLKERLSTEMPARLDALTLGSIEGPTSRELQS